MKIAIVTGHFMPEVGYQEVYLARSFSRLGHKVAVFTSDKHSPSCSKLKLPDYVSGRVEDKVYGFEIHRLKPIISIGAGRTGRSI